MSWVPWIILVIVMGMLAYPIMMIVPTGAQKKLIALRTAASRQGLEVEVRTPKLPDKLKSDYGHLSHCASYRLVDYDSGLTKTCLALRGNHSGDWFWINDSRPPASLVEALLPAYHELPAYCLAVEHSRAGTALFVRETFAIDEIEKIYTLLTKLNKIIRK